MSYAPYCMVCHSKTENKNENKTENKKTQLRWNADFSTEDYGYEISGICGVYSCEREDCGAVYEIMDFFIDDGEDQRVIKYSRDDEYYVNKQEEEMISTCLYCATTLVETNSEPTTDIYGTEFEFGGITTTLRCPECNTEYNVVDLYTPEELYPYCENGIEIQESRTIFLR